MRRGGKIVVKGCAAQAQQRHVWVCPTLPSFHQTLFDSLYAPLSEAIGLRISGGAGGVLKTPVFGKLPEISTVLLRAVVRHDFAGSTVFPKELFHVSDDCAAADNCLLGV